MRAWAVTISAWPGCSHLQAWLRLEAPPPRLLVCVVIGGASVPPPWASPQSCLSLHNMAAGFSPTEWAKRARQKPHISHDPDSRHTQSFHDILLVPQVSPFQCGRRPHKDMNTRGLDSLGTILKAGYHTQLLQCSRYSWHSHMANLDVGRTIFLPRALFYLLPLTASMILFIAFFPHSHPLQPDPHSLSLGLFFVSFFMFHCQIVPEIFIAEGRREGKKIFTEVSLLDSQYKAISFFTLARFTLLVCLLHFIMPKNICLLLDSNFQKPCFLGFSMSQAPGSMEEGVWDEERERKQKPYYHATIAIHQLFVNDSFCIHLIQ